MRDAHVFIASSTRGTVTDAAGRFLLDAVPAGATRLYVSLLGHAPAHRDLLVRPGDTLAVDFRLDAAVLQGPEVTVTAERDDRWPKRLERFERLFIGESENAAETEILNPEVLSFEATWWGRLAARASEPLVVENRALGYRITYFLKEFTAEGGTIRYDGEPLFEAMAPASEAEAARWEANRRRAYAGSFDHFMDALLAGTTHDEGFLTFLQPDRSTHAPRGFRLDPSSLLTDGPEPGLYTLRFAGLVEVVYAREEESDAYRRWQHGSTWGVPGNQTSWFELTDGPTTVDHTGEVVDPYGVTVYGHFAFERLADRLPRGE